MILSVILSWMISRYTSRTIDDLFAPAGHINYIVRYIVGMLSAWVAFGILTNDMQEPQRTQARRSFGLAALLVGLGVAGRRIGEVVHEANS